MSHPRRVALGYRLRAWAAYAGAVLALGGGAILGVAESNPTLAGVGAVLAVLLLAAGRFFGDRSARYAVGAASESQVAKVLRGLAADGWKVEHSVTWPGRGDVDHVVGAPGGATFAVETKTSRYDPQHLRQARDAAAFIGRGCVPVLCLARRRNYAATDAGVEIVSADRLATRLRQLARER